MKNNLITISAIPLLLILCLAYGCKQGGKTAEEKATADTLRAEEIPQVVMDALAAKFPMAMIDKWTKETEDSVVIYDIEFNQEGMKYEADIKEDGSIHNWEKSVDAAALPDAVKKAVEARFPGAVLKEIMEITAVVDGMDTLEGYEIVLETAEMKEMEITFAPDGTVLEEEEGEE